MPNVFQVVSTLAAALLAALVSHGFKKKSRVVTEF